MKSTMFNQDDIFSHLSMTKNFSQENPASVEEVDALMTEISQVVNQQQRNLTTARALMSERIREIEDAILVGQVNLSRGAVLSLINNKSGHQLPIHTSLANNQNPNNNNNQQQQNRRNNNNNNNLLMTPDHLNNNASTRSNGSSYQNDAAGTPSHLSAGGTPMQYHSTNHVRGLQYQDVLNDVVAENRRAQQEQRENANSNANHTRGYMSMSSSAAPSVQQLQSRQQQRGGGDNNNNNNNSNNNNNNNSNSTNGSMNQGWNDNNQNNNSNRNNNNNNNAHSDPFSNTSNNNNNNSNNNSGLGIGIPRSRQQQQQQQQNDAWGQATSQLSGGGGNNNNNFNNNNNNNRNDDSGMSLNNNNNNNGKGNNRPGASVFNNGQQSAGMGATSPYRGQSMNNVNAAYFVTVEFKRGRRLTYESTFRVSKGDFVVVGGDRGEDVGTVHACWPILEAPPPNAVAERAQKDDSSAGTQVIRVATITEVAQLQGIQSELEARATEVAQQKARDHGLNMRIVDAEYQFDRKKLTFYYQANNRLDFRQMVKDLFKTFRARIWMELDPLYNNNNN